MRLLYATTIDVPSTRANRLQVMSMAEAFSRRLPGDFLLGLRAKNVGYYSDVPHQTIGDAATRSYRFAWRYMRLAKEKGFSHIYCREEKLLFFMLVYNSLYFRLPIQFSYELHHLVYLHARWYRFVLRRVHRIISITAGMEKVLVESGYPAEKILVAPDAVDIAFFDIPVGKDDARRSLKLPMEKRLVLYAGTIDEPWKGAGVLYEAAKQFGDDYLFVVVGGKRHYVEEFNSLHPPTGNLVLVGYVPHEAVPLYLKAADILVLPNSAQAEISRIATSPMKLFEYMAAERPIVASDLPSIREILNEKNARLVPPDDPPALAGGIRALVSDPHTGAALAEHARLDVEEHTWEKRAQAVLSFLTT